MRLSNIFFEIGTIFNFFNSNNNYSEKDFIIKKDLNSMKSDLNSMKSDLNSMKSDLNSMKSDLNSMKSDWDKVGESLVSILNKNK